MTRTILDDIVSGLRLRSASVAQVDVLAPRFRRILLSGPALRGAAWTPGDKVQLLTPGLRLRTYTPTRWDATAGETELLVFLHGDAPGARWAREARAGERVQLFGPRGSLEVGGPSPSLVVGDETSLGLAVANGRDRHAIFEVGDLAEMERVVSAVGLDATLIERSHNLDHLDALTRAVLSKLSPGSALVLSGRAQMAADVRRRLKSTGQLPRTVKTKAYWAPGKTGLD